MKTTVDIPDKTLRDAMRFAQAKTKREAVVTALEAFNRHHAMAELVKYSGSFHSLMTNEEIEAMELISSSLPAPAITKWRLRPPTAISIS